MRDDRKTIKPFIEHEDASYSCGLRRRHAANHYSMSLLIATSRFTNKKLPC